MHKEGHVGAALLVYSPIGVVATLVGDSGVSMLGAVVAATLSTLPDVDSMLPGVPHRGPTHTVWFALAVGVALAGVGGYLGFRLGPVAGLGGALFGLLVGTGTVCSHLAADVITPSGIEPFVPLREWWYSYDVVRSANPIANYALLGLGATAFVLSLGVARSLG